MARKYDLISELYRRTAHAVVSDVQNWQAFLRCACRNYRLRFDEQLLIYAQRPDATAVLEIERWNDKFGRWVNRGAKGIAVFEDADRSRQRLTHYFDISDTHASRYSRPVPIWEMKPEYTDDVIESLENTFGELENRESLADAVLSAAKNAVEDNIPDYLGDLMYAADDSFLYGLSEDMITAMYKKAVTNSVAYMMMTRLGIDTEPFFEAEDFSVITNFNTPEALNALGIASSDIAEMGLGEISRTVLALERQNRIIADREKPEYNKAENKSERSFENERADIHNAGRLQSSRLDNAQAAGSDFGQVRSDETEISQGTPQNPVLQSSNELHPDTAFGGNRADSDEAGRNPDEADGGAGGLDREPESGGYDEVGTGNEQSEEQSAGDRESGDHLRLDYYDRSNEDKSLPFFGGDDTIREILGTTPHLKASKEEIRAFYESNPDNAARTEYIKGIFNNDYTELILSDGRRVGYKTWQNVLQLWEGSYLSRTKQSFYDWGVIAQHFEAMRLLGELQDTMKPLPSVDGQLNFLDMQAEEKTSAFSFSQEIIDAVLTRGSGISEGKFRIYEQFEKSLSTKENADFLKDEYGWGGAYPVIVGAGIDEQHDGKGILISKGIGDDKPHIRLNWNQVEKRIAELIRLDRYLNPKEKEIYPQWLEKQEERRAELAEEQKNREILSSAPPKQESVQAAESEPQQEAQYAYHLGDTVYMGADEYEILAFDDKRVVLHDMQYPLFQKELERDEFDRRVRENPMNDHLKVMNQAAVAEQQPRFNSIEFEKLIPHHMRFKETDLVNGNEMYWVTQEIFTAGDLRKFQQAVQSYDGDIKKFYVTPRDLSPSYSFEEDMENKVLAVITPDTILQDDYIQAVRNEGLGDYLQPEEKADSAEAPAFDIGMGYLGNGLTVWNRAVEENGDYQNIAHISSEGEIRYYVDGLPDDVVSRIEQAAAREQQKALFSAAYKVGDRVYLDGKPFEITRVDDWNVELMDRSVQNPQPRLEQKDSFMRLVQQNERSSFTDTYRQYSEIKSANPDSLVLYQMGDFFEAYGADAQTVSEALELNLASRSIGGNQRTQMCGFPANHLETYVNMLLDRGFDVVVSSLENGERSTRNIVSTNKEDPVQSKPVGRIDYLHTDGTVRESVEYTSPYQLEKDIKEENYYGVPFTVVFYKDKDGNTIPQNFISELDPQPKGVEIIDSPYLANDRADEMLRQAEQIAGENTLPPDERFFVIETDDGYAIWDDLTEAIYIDDEGVSEEFKSEWQANDYLEQVKKSVSEKEAAEWLYVERAKQDTSAKQPEQNEAEPFTPAFSQPKRSRVQTFDLHPEIPLSERHTFDLASHEVPEAGKKERFRRNMEAIRVLKECEFDNRFATPEEQEILSQYVGWGGIPEAFDENNSSWADEFIELYTALSPDEYESARASTLTAFYTPPVVISSIYKAMEQMGFKEGNILEPSCGIGNFIGMLPQSMQDSKIYGVEIDKISAGIAQQFMYEFLDTPVYARWNIKVHYSKLTGEWNVEGKSYDRGNLKAYNTYGTKRVNAYKIIEDTLNMKDVRVFDYIEDDEGKKKAVLNKKETAIAQSKQELIKQGFQDWVWRDPARREKLVRLYNDKFNSIRPREYDGSHIIFSGMNPEIELREHQKNAVAHILYGGNTLLAHAVGAGKTFEMTAAAMESKRLGLCNKSLFVVPNHLTEQWAAEFLQLYPAANILVATKKDFEMKNRKRFCGRIATGDYDAVIIGHSQFEKIPISIERQRAVLEQQLSDIIEGIADIKRNRGDRFSVKQLEKTKKSLQTKLEKLNDQSRKDDVVTFEELGIDRLFIDESHYYKNLYLYTKMRNVGGIAQTEAQKSSDLFMKCRYLDEITGGRGVVFATGTPISNSMVELYTIQRYLQYRTLQEHDLQHFDAWASMFGETVTAVELTPEGYNLVGR